MEHPHERQSGTVAILCGLVALASGQVAAQAPNATPLTLSAAVALAQSRHPTVRAREATADAAAEGRTLAQTAYLPHVDLLWQQNRATRANVFGLLLPQSVVPGISGPVLDTDRLSPSSVWGTAAGASLSWELVDFGRRAAAERVADTAVTSANAQRALTRLDVGIAAAEAFLRVLATDQQVLAARANVERVEVFERTVSVLVDSELRPAVDGTRAAAELAGAQIQLIQAEQLAEVARIGLGEALGMDGAVGLLDSGRLFDAPVAGLALDMNLEQHPAVQLRQAAIETREARADLAGRSHLPSLAVQSAVFARGSGAAVAGVDRDGRGLFPDVANWAAGVTVTVPVLERIAAHSRQRIELAHAQAAEAERENTIRRLRAQEASAQALIRAAEQIAANTPVQLEAAQAAERQATGRYQAGLGTVTDVADAQRVLVQAEVDDALARLEIWRARLALTRSQGDLEGFLDQLAP